MGFCFIPKKSSVPLWLATGVAILWTNFGELGKGAHGLNPDDDG